MGNHMTPEKIKKKIKNKIVILMARHYSVMRILTWSRDKWKIVSGKYFPGTTHNFQIPFEVDQQTLVEVFEEALQARREGDKRLALLLAHQCDCASGDSADPAIGLLLAELHDEYLKTS